MVNIWEQAQKYGWTTTKLFSVVVMALSAGLCVGLITSQWFFGLLLGLFLAYAIPLEQLEKDEKRQRKQKREALIDAIRSIENHYTGNLAVALESSLPMMQEPIKSEMQEILTAERIGVKPRLDDPDKELFVYCLNVAKETGEAKPLLERIIKNLENKIQLEDEMEVEIQQRKVETRYLFGLFVAVWVMLHLFANYYVGWQPSTLVNVMGVGMLLLNVFAWETNRRIIHKTRENIQS